MRAQRAVELEALIERWIRPELRALSPYHVPDATGMVKLDAMENPYPLPAELVDDWLAALRGVAINRYPDPAAAELKARLQTVMGVPEGQSLMLGNGSDELIQIAIMALAGPGRSVLAPEPTFVMYRMIAGYAGLTYHGVPLREDFSLDPGALLEGVARTEPAVVFLAYPNNPTGNLWDRALIEELLRVATGLVIVDEAYAPFASDSFMRDLGRHPNLLVMRTVSKMGLAGLRLGLLCGPEPWITQLDKLRLPYNINVLTQASAAFALDHAEVFAQQAAAIRRDREALAQAVGALPGMQVFPSEANFLLLRTRAGRASQIFEGLRRQGVLIKNLSAAGPALADCLRVTVGTPEENQRFLAALSELL
jgi:histidinol-phosphate aminotransferase